MLQRIVTEIDQLFREVVKQEMHKKGGDTFDITGTYWNPVKKRLETGIVTVSFHSFKPYKSFGQSGYFYPATRKRKVKKDGVWTTIEEEIERYELSVADKQFIYHCYVHAHMTAQQIYFVSGIPQPYIYRYIKHCKLKPQYTRKPIPENEKALEEINEPFHIDPYPTRSEWKARREELGLKNGENWRNTPFDENPGPKQYGSGKTSSKKKLSKLRRKEERKKRNIQKFNSHQNNRYGITPENPEGTKDPYKQYRESLERKKRGENKKD